jgi:hypothetical protein
MKRHNDAPISELLKQWAQKPSVKSHLIQQKIEANWEAWFGKVIAKNTDRIQIRGNELILRISSGPVKFEIQSNREKMIHFIHQELGEHFFEKIILV